jgi:hypothetical protein
VRESVANTTVFSRRASPIPSWAFLLQVLPLHPLKALSRSLPLLAFTRNPSSRSPR